MSKGKSEQKANTGGGDGDIFFATHIDGSVSWHVEAHRDLIHVPKVFQTNTGTFFLDEMTKSSKFLFPLVRQRLTHGSSLPHGEVLSFHKSRAPTFASCKTDNAAFFCERESMLTDLHSSYLNEVRIRLMKYKGFAKLRRDASPNWSSRRPRIRCDVATARRDDQLGLASRRN